MEAGKISSSSLDEPMSGMDSTEPVSLVDSSQAGILLDLLQQNKMNEFSAEMDLQIDDSVKKVHEAFADLVKTATGQRVSVSVNSVGLLASDWASTHTDAWAFTQIRDTENNPILFLGFPNGSFRKFLTKVLGGPGEAGSQSSPLTKSENRFIGLIADKLIHKLYTDSNPIEGIRMPGVAVPGEAADLLEFHEGGNETVCLLLDLKFSDDQISCELLFPLTVLQPLPGSSSSEPTEHDEPVENSEDGLTPSFLSELPVLAECELASLELPISQLEKLCGGEMLISSDPLDRLKLLDADGNPYVSGKLKLEDERFQIRICGFANGTSGDLM